MVSAIKNFDQLTSTSLRKQALLILESGVLAVSAKKLVEDGVWLDKKYGSLHIQKEKFSLKDYNRILVIGFGRGAAEIAAELEIVLENYLSRGLVVDTGEKESARIKYVAQINAETSLANIKATQELVELVQECGDGDLILCIVCDGGEGLLFTPASVALESAISIMNALHSSKALASEIGIVAKHLSTVLGGGLAKIAFPATVVNLVFSSAAKTDIGKVSGGPTLLDGSTVHDAMRILNKYDILKASGLASIRLQETPKESKYFEEIITCDFNVNTVAVKAMMQRSEDLGFRSRNLDTTLESEIESNFFVKNQISSGECLFASVHHTPFGGNRKVHQISELEAGTLISMKHLVPNSILCEIESSVYSQNKVRGLLVDSNDAVLGVELHKKMTKSAIEHTELLASLKEQSTSIETEIRSVGDLGIVLYIKE